MPLAGQVGVVESQIKFYNPKTRALGPMENGWQRFEVFVDFTPDKQGRFFVLAKGDSEALGAVNALLEGRDFANSVNFDQDWANFVAGNSEPLWYKTTTAADGTISGSFMTKKPGCIFENVIGSSRPVSSDTYQELKEMVAQAAAEKKLEEDKRAKEKAKDEELAKHVREQQAKREAGIEDDGDDEDGDGGGGYVPTPPRSRSNSFDDGGGDGGGRVMTPVRSRSNSLNDGGDSPIPNWTTHGTTVDLDDDDNGDGDGGNVEMPSWVTRTGSNSFYV